MKSSWFPVEKDIINREDLDIYEKMLCVVIAKEYYEEENGNLINEVIAKKMGCSEKKVDEAIKKLKEKGFIVLENKKMARIIKKDDYEYVENFEVEKFFEEISYEDKMAEVHKIIEEKINDSEARIILNFAKNNLDLVRDKYSKVKKMQISDKIEALINELQRKESVSIPSGNQINLEKLNKLKLDNYYKK